MFPCRYDITKYAYLGKGPSCYKLPSALLVLNTHSEVPPSAGRCTFVTNLPLRGKLLQRQDRKIPGIELSIETQVVLLLIELGPEASTPNQGN